MRPKKDKQNKDLFVPFPLLLFDEILIREFFLIEMKIIFLLVRLTVGCKGNDKKDSLISRQSCIMLQKKEFMVLGIPEQSINRTLKKLIKNNVISEEKTELTIRRQSKIVYCYSINPNPETWNVPYISSEEQLGKLIGLQINLQPYQLAKISNIQRYKNLLMQLKLNSPLKIILKIYDITTSNKDKKQFSDLFIFSKNYTGQEIILIGSENFIEKAIYYNLFNQYPNIRCLLAILILDMKLLFEIVTLKNTEIEGAIVELVKNPEPALEEIYAHWLIDTEKGNENPLLRDEYSRDMNNIIDKFNLQESMDGAITIINRDGVTITNCFMDDVTDSSEDGCYNYGDNYMNDEDTDYSYVPRQNNHYNDIPE